MRSKRLPARHPRNRVQNLLAAQPRRHRRQFFQRIARPVPIAQLLQRQQRGLHAHLRALAQKILPLLVARNTEKSLCGSSSISIGRHPPCADALTWTPGEDSSTIDAAPWHAPLRRQGHADSCSPPTQSSTCTTSRPAPGTSRTPQTPRRRAAPMTLSSLARRRRPPAPRQLRPLAHRRRSPRPRRHRRRLAEVKHRIDRTNQLRNDLAEELDRTLLAWLDPAGLPNPDAPLNSESPGLIIDRLSILALKIYHTREEAERADAPQATPSATATASPSSKSSAPTSPPASTPSGTKPSPAPATSSSTAS